MGNRNPLLTLALCISLTVHLLGLSILALWYATHTPLPKLAAIDREKLMVEAMNHPKTAPPPPSAKKKKLPLPKMEIDPAQMPKDDSGEANGKGTANRSTPGDKPMQANQGYEQADLMRDTPDDSLLDPNSPLPAAMGAPVGTNASKQSTAQHGQYTPDFVAESQALADANADTSKQVSSQKGIGPLPKATEGKENNAPSPSGVKTPVAMATPNGRQNTVPKALRGHRAVSSDTDSVAFAKANSISIHNGKLEGRQGLKVSTKRVVFGDASYSDAEQMGGFRLVVGARVDADGNVSDTTILQSSGSRNIDLDYQTSIYDWTFEPPKDKDGHPMATTWAITCE